MKSPNRSRFFRLSAALLVCGAFGACSTTQEPVPLPLDSEPVGTGTVVATRGDTITVHINGKLVKIQLEGFAEEGDEVAAAVRKSPAHKGLAQFADPAAGTRAKR